MQSGQVTSQMLTEHLAALMQSGELEPSEREGVSVEVRLYIPPDYEGVYGSALNQLEAAWLARLAAQPTATG